jgi:hypothetical protein
MYRETGQAAYESFAEYIARHRRDQLPTWESLYEVERDAWRAGAHAAVQEGWH